MLSLKQSLLPLAAAGLLMAAPAAMACACKGDARPCVCTSTCPCTTDKASEKAAPKPQVMMPAKREALWFAPFDNYPNQTVRVLGLVELPANEGTIDRAIRLGLGAGLLTVAALDPLSGGTNARLAASVGGGLMTVTGLTGTCLMYIPFGLSTRH